MLLDSGCLNRKSESTRNKKRHLKSILYPPFNQAAVCRHFLYNKTIGVQHIIQGCAETVSKMCQTFQLCHRYGNLLLYSHFLLFSMIKCWEERFSTASSRFLSFIQQKPGLWQTQFVYALCLFVWSKIEWTKTLGRHGSKPEPTNSDLGKTKYPEETNTGMMEIKNTVYFSPDNTLLEAHDTSAHLLHTVFHSHPLSRSLMALLTLIYTELEQNRKCRMSTQKHLT